MASALIKKLGIKPGQRLLVLNAPSGYWSLLGVLPDGVKLSTSVDGSACDVVQAFVRSRADVNTTAPEAIAAVKPLGYLWLTYPKKTSDIKTDISRDQGWDLVIAAGFEGVAIVSVDDTWSAMRFRPSSAVKSRGK